MSNTQWTECMDAMDARFEDYCRKDRADLFSTPRFLQLSSRTSYVGYPGAQASTLELAPDAADEVVGAAMLEMLDASRQMMLG